MGMFNSCLLDRMCLFVSTSRCRHDHTHDVPVGSAVILFTDALVECPHQAIDCGMDRLAAIATENGHLSLRAFVQEYINRHPGDGHDDLAVRPPSTAPPTRPDDDPLE
ncbi:SpoIIE family protein phosphatase [Streptomyces sp. NPDC058891]|uniref:SpoIIE family protein phosphatase n=1 Tax=Streptomyces sp. NPDC058891 TaxID=3346667 RepID=UPI0036D15AAD